MVDKRLWCPDETCEPFLFETLCASSDTIFGRFQIPVGTFAVIAAVNIYEHAALDNKRIPIALERGRVNIEDTPLLDEKVIRCIILYGSLMNVEEFSGVAFFPANRHIPGWAQGSPRITNVDVNSQSGTPSRPVRHLLEGGNIYTLHKVQNTLPLYAVSLFGWTFPRRS